jgi:hypothetical protein
MPKFFELELRWGSAAAHHYLVEAERAAKIPSWTLVTVDVEARLANAFRAQDLELANRNIIRVAA